MLYIFIRKLVRAAILLFCKQLRVENKQAFTQKGPLLVIANHPNSFLDAILIGSVFNENVHFLARGDAFKQKKHRFLLKMLKMIPVYRLSEGKENLYLNEYAFTESCRILNKGGIVLIFIEGICINSHQLQPFKKGAARIAARASSHSSLNILPVAITYNSFSTYGKQVLIAAGNTIKASELLPYKEEAKNYVHFNAELKTMLEQLTRFLPPPPRQENLLIKAIAVLGRWLHCPLYISTRNRIASKVKGTVFYDSVLFGVLLFLYPIYLLIIAGFVIYITGSIIIAVLIVILHFITARIYLLYK